MLKSELILTSKAQNKKWSEVIKAPKSKKKKKANRNDAAAEQWARFFEQHGPEVAAKHGYTQQHYDQYLRRGGVPGGPDAVTF